MRRSKQYCSKWFTSEDFSLRSRYSDCPVVQKVSDSESLKVSSQKSGVKSGVKSEVNDQNIFENAKPYSEVPKPRGLPYFGTVLHYIFNGGGKYLHEYVQSRHRDLGPIYKEKYSTEPFEVLFIGDIEGARDVYKNEGKTPLSFVIGGEELFMKLSGIKRGLLFSQGEDWLKVRRPMNNLLLKRNDYFHNFDLTSQVIREHISGWVSEGGDTVDPEGDPGWTRVTDLGVKVNRIGVCTFGAFAFGNRFHTHMKEIEAHAEGFHALTVDYWEGNMAMQIIPPVLAHKFKLPLWSKFESAITNMLNIGNQWVDMAAQDLEAGDMENIKNPKVTEPARMEGFLHLLLSEYNADDSARRIFADFIAALESETTMIQWILYVMGRNPEAQEKLYGELMSNKGQGVTWHDTEGMQYLSACIKESLRMYPSNCFTVRILPQDSLVKGYRIPGGTIAAVALMSAQRQPDIFPDPERFWPKRWFRATEQSLDGLGSESEVGKPVGVHGCQPYLPFAWGSSRGCIFRRVSVRRMTLFLANFVKIYEFRTREVKPVMRSLMIPDRDMELRIRRR